MTSPHPSGASTTWYCVLDRECKLLYLGTDKQSATGLSGEHGVLAEAARMGDAMSRAALAVAALRRKKP